MQHVLLSLSTPFIDGTYSKVGTRIVRLPELALTPWRLQIDKVDIDYFRKAKRFDLSDETKVHATKPEWDEYVKNEPADGTLASLARGVAQSCLQRLLRISFPKYSSLQPGRCI